MTLPFRDDLLSSLLARCKSVPLSRFSQPLFWLLLLLLAQQCAVLTWRLFDLTQSPRPLPWQPAVTPGQGAGPARLDLGNLSRLSLFGKAPQPKGDKVADAVAADAPKTQLNAQLNGVLASTEPSKSIAIIALQFDSGRQRRIMGSCSDARSRPRTLGLASAPASQASLAPALAADRR